jgi:lysyl-tRNA synthetase, class II
LPTGPFIAGLFRSVRGGITPPFYRSQGPPKAAERRFTAWIIGARIRFLTVRRSAALAVAALAIEAIVSGVARDGGRHHPLLGSLTPPDLPSEAHLLSIVAGISLLAVTPRLWGGTRTAASLAIAGLVALSALSTLKGHYEQATLELALGAMLAASRRSFPLGCRNRPQLAVVLAALGAWGLAYCALRVAPLVPAHPAHEIERALRHSVTHALRLSADARRSDDWISLIDALIGCAVLVTVLAMRSLLRPARSDNRHVEHEYLAARAIVERHGEDSLSPFILRPDKALQFAAGGVLSYRVIRRIAIVSSDPVAPGDGAPRVLASFLEVARRRGWQVVVWGASERHLAAYKELGLSAFRAGEEAFVDPCQFTLQGRAVRKLRQSVHRVGRRGWEISVHEGRTIGASLELELDQLEWTWRARQRRLLGFAMGMGIYEAHVRPDDLYVLARSPDGALGAAMRFVSHCGKLSLDTMRRVGDTPNGLNEALVCRALDAARARGVREVSLNYAGLAHLVRDGSSADRWLSAAITVVLGRRFQMERLVRFNEKFAPQWRPRYLVCEAPTALPRAVVSVLQAEGYVPELHRPGLPRGRIPLPSAVTRSAHPKGAG